MPSEGAQLLFSCDSRARAWLGDWKKPWAEAGRMSLSPDRRSQDQGSQPAGFSMPTNLSIKWSSKCLRFAEQNEAT